MFVLDHLDRHALERPDAVAVSGPSGTWTFAALRDAVSSATGALAGLGVDRGTLVGLDLPVAEEWILDLALLRLAARSASLRGVSDPGELGLDLLITEPGLRSAPAELIVEVDTASFARRFLESGRHAVPAEFDGPEAIVRLIMTSGTTGRPRAAAYSLRAFSYRIGEGGGHWTDGRPELTLIGLSTTGGFHAAVASLILGVPYLALDRIDADSMRFVAHHGIRVLCGSPTQVAQALRVMQSEGLTLPTLEEVRLAAAGPSERLLAFIADTLGVPVRGVYGSTEGGGISQVIYADGVDRLEVGVPLPDVDLEVVDVAARPVAAGVEGTVRYRTPGLVSGYLVDGSIVPFPGGWFVPGDRGMLTTDGSLVLVGRDSELLNLGGVKLDPQRIDDLAAGFPGVRDAAAFPLERSPGIPEVGLAVVGDADLHALDRELRAQLAIGHPTAFWRVDTIPRSRLGKALRARIAEEFERA